MTILGYCLSLLLATALGYCCVQRLSHSKAMTSPLYWALSIALGLGLCSLLTFFIHLALGIYVPWAPAAAAALVITALGLTGPKPFRFEPVDITQHWPGFALLAAIGVGVGLEAYNYPMGGWDAWSCWNLKAKFIYLGADTWREMLDPLLWRSNTHYPLLLPCITVWGWDLAGSAAGWIPQANSVLFTLLSAAILVFTLSALTRKWLMPVALTAVVFLLPFNVTLSASQYSDVLIGLFLLAALSSFLAEEWALMGVSLGLLSFAKTEGTVAAVALAGLTLVMHPRSRQTMVWPLLLSSAATIVFTLTMAPANAAFVNGLTSAEKPATLARLGTIAAYPFMEALSIKWNGIWPLLAAGLLWQWKKIGKGKPLTFALFFVIYLGVVLAYYLVNTFFPIEWWLSNTLNRILFALLPSLMLWLGMLL